MKKINDYVIGEMVTTVLLIKNVTQGVANKGAGKPFLGLVLSDSSGTVDGKMWDVSELDIATYTDGTIVYLEGEMQEYNGKRQIRIQNIRKTEAHEPYQIEDFLQAAPLSQQHMKEQITNAALSIKNETLQKITLAFLQKYDYEFFVYPAAKLIHHAYPGGLAYHKYNMLFMGKAVCDIYPWVNRDMIYTSIMLHDIGKIHELTSEIDSNLTTKGKLIGHIAIMTIEVNDMAKSLGIDPECEEVMLLQHLILSHHGQPEWGSAKVPLTLEAEILHNIDRMDAHINIISDAVTKTKPGDFTEKVWAVENRSFYKPLMNQ